MQNKTKVMLIAGAAVLALLLLPSLTFANNSTLMFNNVADFIAGLESFSATPYWDFKRYSWGYGTPAPNGADSGTITEAQARQELLNHAQSDYQQLQPQISRALNQNQWAALLSFSYNEGVGHAENLINDINAGNDAVLGPHWKKYIYAGGVVNSDLVDRRNTEFALWLS